MASFMWMLLTEPSYKRTLLGVRLASEESKPEDTAEAITSGQGSEAHKPVQSHCLPNWWNVSFVLEAAA
jgi:hypothetical protein